MEYERFIEQGKPYNHKADPELVKKKKKQGETKWDWVRRASASNADLTMSANPLDSSRTKVAN